MRSIQRTDFISALVVITIGGSAFAQSLRMPRFEERGVDPYTIPGLTPALVSAVIGILGLVLLLRAMRGIAGDPGTITEWSRVSLLRTALTVVLALGYGILLFGHAPFVPVTAGFIFLFTLLSELMSPQRTLSVPIVAAGALALALVMAFGIHFVFTEIFLVTFPR